MRRWLWLLLALVSTVASGQRLTTFAWDAGANWPPGTTVELCSNGACADGITATQHALLVPIQPGEAFDARARAIPPPGYQCGEPLADCPPSGWATVQATWPATPSHGWARYERRENPMTVSASILTSGRTLTSGTSYTTASVTVAAAGLQFLVFNETKSGSFSDGSWPTVSVSGLGRTWELIRRQTYAVWDAAPNFYNAVHIFRATGTAQTGALTVTSAQSIYSAAWDIVELSGMNTSGSNGSGAIVQSVGARGTNTTPSVTMAAFAQSNNAVFFVAGASDGSVRTQAPGSGLTELSDHGVTYVQQSTNFRNSSQTGLSTTLSGSVEGWGAIGIEIADGDAAAAASLPVLMHHYSH